MKPLYEVALAWLRRHPWLASTVDPFVIGLKSRWLDPRALPRVAVVCVCRDGEPWIGASLRSLQQQSHRHFECVVVDDASEDGSRQLVAKIAQRDPRFRLVGNDRREGRLFSYQRGLQELSGELVTFLAGGERLRRHSLWRRVRVLARARGERDVGGSYCLAEDSRHRELGRPPFRQESTATADLDFVSEEGLYSQPLSTLLLRVDVLRLLGGFDVGLPEAVGELALCARVLRHGFRLVGSGDRGVRAATRIEGPPGDAGTLLRAERELIEAVDRPLDSEAVAAPASGTDGAPFLFREPFAFYRRALRLGERVVPRAASALAAGHDGEAADLLAALPRDSALLLRRHGRVDEWAREAVQAAAQSTSNSGTRDAEKSAASLESRLWELLESSGKIGTGARGGAAVDVLFMPHNAYHTREMARVADELERRGLSHRFVEITRRYRDEGVGRELERLELEGLEYHDDVVELASCRSLFVMNDWETVVADAVLRAKESRIPTFGLIEGVQDYIDTHVADLGKGRIRAPYQRVDHPLLVGDYDRKFFAGREFFVTGSPRFEALAQEPAVAVACRHRRVVVNSNFTYGLYSDVREAWLRDCVAACERAGIECVISQHPADNVDLGELPVAHRPLYDLLRDSRLLISRFSGAILEAMALGTPVIYHNPHGERMDTFRDPMGAFSVTRGVDELERAVAGLLESPAADHRGISAAFFRFHVSIDEGRSAAQRIADAVESVLRRPAI